MTPSRPTLRPARSCRFSRSSTARRTLLLTICPLLPACAPALPDEPPAQFTAAEIAMIHGRFADLTYARLTSSGIVPAGAVRVDSSDPPIAGRPAVALLRFRGLVGEGDGQIPPGWIVHRAELRLTTLNSGSGARAHRMLVPWDPAVTWAGAFGGDGIQTDDVEAAAAADFDSGFLVRGQRVFDVTAAVQAWADGAPNYGWALLPAGSDSWEFRAPTPAGGPDEPRLSVLFGPPHPRLALASGDITPESAVLLVQPTAAGPVAVRVATDPDFDRVIARHSLESADLLVPVKLEQTGLTPATRYYYDAVDAAGSRRAGTFATPSRAGQRRGLRFGVSGDWRGDLRPYPAVANVVRRRLDFFVALGDTIYADVPSPAVPVPQSIELSQFRAKHAEVYADAFGRTSLADIRASTPWFSVIDDHEVTNDFAGGAPPASHPLFAGSAGEFINRTALFEHALRAFHEFHPIREEFYGDTGDPRTAGARKLYRARQFGLDAALFVLDARSFRDEAIPALLSPGAPDARTWFRNAFAPARTMLGRAQFDELTADLLAAEQADVTWKFILVPEPIQNLGPILGQDRFEGYAAERSRLLRFIDENHVRNVVFITADIHSTIVNNLTYQLEYGGPQIATSAWEISTGAVAYAAPFGPTVVEILSAVPVIGPLIELLYDSLDRDGKDQLLTDAIDTLLRGWGYDPIGLDGAPVPATLLQGRWSLLHTYGWTEFEIDAATQRLTVTTYGIDWYDRDELLSDPIGVLSRTPQVLSRFVVEPQ